MPQYDFECDACGLTYEDLVKSDELSPCPTCKKPNKHLMPATHTFTTIVATTLTSKKFKAGYQHQYVNRPATKIQVGASGKDPT